MSHESGSPAAIGSERIGSERPARVLFFNEGNLGGHILGQGQLEAVLRTSIDPSLVQARFAGLGGMGRWQAAAASRPLPGLAAHNLDLRTLRWHLVQSLRARRALEHELRAFRPDVLHLHTQSIALLSRSIMGRLPVVLSIDTTIHDWSTMPAWAAWRGASRETAPSRLLERRAFRGAALVAAFTAWARAAVEREEPRANVIEHHPGIDLDRYRPADRAPRPRPRILFVGGRFKEKGGEDLLRALEGRLGTDVELDVVTRDHVPPLEGVTVHHLDPSDPQLLDLHQQADLMCLPTYGDTNPWVILEAMGCATPVISSAVGAIPEMLDEGRAGTIVPHGDPAALREAVLALLEDPVRREQVGRAARARCEERYDARRQSALLAQQLRTLSEDRRAAG